MKVLPAVTNDFLFHLLFQSSVSIFKFVNFITDKSLFPLESRFGDEERRLMHLVPAPAVRLMKRCEREKIRDGCLFSVGWQILGLKNFYYENISKGSRIHCFKGTFLCP